MEMCETYGSDALRWFLMSSAILRGGDLQIDREGAGIKDVMRLVCNPVYNAYYFFTLYANSDGVKASFRTDARGLLDRYILAKTRNLVSQVTTSMDSYDIAGACVQITTFLDAMNNWYIRRSRARFWKTESDQDKQDAYDTLFSVLVTVARVAAPLLPLLGEYVYRGLTGEESVHLGDWPSAEDFPADDALVAVMDKTRDVCSAALSLRDAHKLRTRLPLGKLTVAGKGHAGLHEYEGLIRDEVNVKRVEFSDDAAQFGDFVLQVNAKAVGKKLGQTMKAVMTASKTFDWEVLADGSARVGPATLTADEFDLRLASKPGIASQALPSNDAVVALDTNVTPELEQEGVARDLVRLVQQARKDAGLHVSDHIRLYLSLSGEQAEGARAAIGAHEAYVKEQTLADELSHASAPKTAHRSQDSLGQARVEIGLLRAE
jgi:isoleucyl-tRNA synthetase